jgi:hypothetical protein
MLHKKEGKSLKVKDERKGRYFINELFLLFSFFTVGLLSVQAQDAIPASGGNASGGGGTVSYTVGQVVYTTNTGTNGSVAQGVQQPYEISVVTGIENSMKINLSCTVYPNPATTHLTLKVENNDNENLSYQLYEISGKLLENKKVEGNETTIFMEHRPVATYLLKVVQTDQASPPKEIKTFKIVKN